MNVETARGRHPDDVASRFSHLGPFHHEGTLQALYGDSWLSVLVTEDRRAFLHVAQPVAVGDSGCFDAEAWLGYPHPTCVGGDKAFVHRAFAAYSGACRELDIVAELLRFDPLVGRPALFDGIDNLRIGAGRRIAYAPIVWGDNDEQLAVYSAPCRRQIASARGRLVLEEISTENELVGFVRLLHDSLQRVGASPRWLFGAGTFRRMSTQPHVRLLAVRAITASPSRLVACALVVGGPPIGYSLLVGNECGAAATGAQDFLSHETIRLLARDGYRWLCLGGGRSSDHGDNLLRFKAKFAGGNLLPLWYGVAVHDAARYRELTAMSAGRRRPTAEAQPAGEIVATFMPYRLGGDDRRSW